MVKKIEKRVHSGGGTLGISGWGCASGTLGPLAYTRTSSARSPLPITQEPTNGLLVQLKFATLYWSKLSKSPHLSTLLRLICVNLNLPISLFYILEWQFLVSLV